MFIFKCFSCTLEDKLEEVRNKGGWFLKLMFHNKGIDMIDLPGILHNKKFLRIVPSFVQHIEPPIVSYSYTKSIRNIIFNHKTVIKDIDFGMGTSNMTCSCSSSRFLYTPANHVITGNLHIVINTELRNLINKGPSFPEQNNINWLLNRNLCLEANRKYKIMWARRENVDIHVLDEWEHTVGNHVENRIKTLSNKNIHKRKKKILKKRRYQECLKKLHDKYVLVPVDTASNNVVVICNKHYIEVMMK